MHLFIWIREWLYFGVRLSCNNLFINVTNFHYSTQSFCLNFLSSFFCITHRTLRHKLLNVMKLCDQLQKIQLNNAVRWFCIFRYINLMAVDISSEQNLTTMRLPFERYPPKVFNNRRDISEKCKCTIKIESWCWSVHA